MKEETRFALRIMLLGLVGLIFIITFVWVMTHHFQEEFVSSKLCVDGDHNINLAGIMCEDKTVSYFGLNPGYSKSLEFMLLMPAMLFTVLFVLGLLFVSIDLIAKREDKK